MKTDRNLFMPATVTDEDIAFEMAKIRTETLADTAKLLIVLFVLAAAMFFLGVGFEDIMSMGWDLPA